MLTLPSERVSASRQPTPGSLAGPVLLQVSLRYQAAEVLFECVTAGTGSANGIAHGHTTVLPSVIDNLDRER